MDTAENTAEEDDRQKISAEVALYDVLEKIFSSLNMKELCRVAAVSKTWNHFANKEKAKRNDIQALVLETEDLEHDFYSVQNYPPMYLQNRWHISEGLRSKPSILLLFFDGGIDYPFPSNVFYTTYNYQLESIDTGIAVMATLGVTFDYTELLACSNLGAGLSIPCTSAIKVKSFIPNTDRIWTYGEQHKLSLLANLDARTFVSTKDEHVCYIYFFNRSSVFYEFELNYYITFYFLEFIECIRTRSEPGTYSLWGAEIDQLTTNIDAYNTREEAWAVAIRISGPAMKSWSIVLKANLSIIETENKLLNLKKSIQLKSSTVALAIVPSNNSECYEQRLAKIKVFKEVFPRIPLISVYVKDQFRQLGINSMDCDPNPVLHHQNSISYLILTTE